MRTSTIFLGKMVPHAHGFGSAASTKSLKDISLNPPCLAFGVNRLRLKVLPAKWRIRLAIPEPLRKRCRGELPKDDEFSRNTHQQSNSKYSLETQMKMKH